MPNPLDTLTKPLQIGARVAFGAFQAAQQVAQGIIGGDHHDEPPREQRQEEQDRPAPSQPTGRRNTQPKQLDDKTITDKVETELFRDTKVAKGKIDVNTADGIVWLRGEAKTPEQIKQLEAQALAIPEVKQVENLLHLPKTPAPTRADTPKPQQKTRRHKSASAARKVTPVVAPSERKTAASAASSPKELAKKHEGRKPAPLGSTGAAGGEAEAKPAAAKPKGAAKPKRTASKSASSTSSKAEPAPKDLAAKGEGRQPAPLGSTDAPPKSASPNGSSGSSS